VSQTNGQSVFGQLRDEGVEDPRHSDHTPTVHLLGTWHVRRESSRRCRSFGSVPKMVLMSLDHVGKMLGAGVPANERGR
jgi:hypothetical protein